jgi:alpha-galactosidase
MSLDEYRTHMSLWAILAAPLLAGNDLSQMTAETKSLLMNKDIIAIDQDALGKQGDRLSKNGDLETWTRSLSGGAVAVGLFNRSTTAAPMMLKLSDLNLKHTSSIRDVWAATTLTAPNSELTATVPPHGVVLLIIKP